jgi:hypothetical protein
MDEVNSVSQFDLDDEQQNCAQFFYGTDEKQHQMDVFNSNDIVILTRLYFGNYEFELIMMMPEIL